MLVQAYDYWHLYKTAGVELQMGGSDQWGNITAGVELISRKEQKQVHAVVAPLLITTSGHKFGKSESGNVWLDPSRTSPYQFYQFWLNAEDADAERWLRIFTFLPDEQIAIALAEHARDPGRRAAQRTLAWEVTALVHGEDEADKAARTSVAVFGGAEVETDYAELAGTMPNARMSREELEREPALVDVLVHAGLASSKSEARRGLQGRGFSVNDQQVGDVARRLTVTDLRQERFVLLRKGKKTYVMLVIDG